MRLSSFFGRFFSAIIVIPTVGIAAVFISIATVRAADVPQCSGLGGHCQHDACLTTEENKTPTSCVSDPDPRFDRGNCCVPKQGAGGPPKKDLGSCVGYLGGLLTQGTCQVSDQCKAPIPDATGCSSGTTCCLDSQAGGPPNKSGPQVIDFYNPLSYNSVESLVANVLSTLQKIIVVLSLVFIVIGAVMYIVSAGNSGMTTLAKGAITAALIGLAIGLAAPSFLKEIGTVLGWGAVNSGPVATARTLSEIALSVLSFLLSIVGVLGIIMLIIGGIAYLTAAGNEDRIDTGKKIFKWAVVGIIVALASLVIVRQLAAFFVA